MASVCKTWSMPTSSINGLCASEYVAESGRNDCSACAKPVENVGDPVAFTSDDTTCIIWRQPDPLHFNGFCTNKFRLSTPQDHVRVSRGCMLCAGPKAISISDCTGCSGDAPLSYLVDITIDGNGSSGGSPDYGCGIASYSGEFVVYNSGADCVWRSAEKELRSYATAGSASNPVTCEAITDSNARSRVELRLSTISVAGVLKTVYSITVNWYGGESSYGSGVNLCSVVARGVASTLDCYEAVADCEHFTRVINIGSSTQWANPYVNITGGGDQIEMTASIRPL